MINEEKVKSMTKAAAYECEEKKNLEICEYYRGDYIEGQMVKGALAYFVTVCLLIVLWIMGGSEELMLKLTQPQYLKDLLTRTVIVTVIGLILYEIAIYTYFSWKYAQAKRSVGGYQNHLKEIHKFYETEESTEDDLKEIDLSNGESTL